MKLKSLIAAAAVFVLSFVACIGTVVFSASAATADSYFGVPDGVTSEITDDGIVFTVAPSEGEDATHTITSTYDFYLPKTTVEYKADNLSVKIADKDYVSGAGIEAEEAGKLEFVLTVEDKTKEAKFTVTSVKTDGKALYTIENGALKADESAMYVDDDSFKFYELENDANKAILSGYKYEGVTFGAYHGFLTGQIRKEIVIIYGPDKAACDKAFATYYEFYYGESEEDSGESGEEKPEAPEYDEGVTVEPAKNVSSSSTTVKFRDYTRDDSCIAVYYGHGNYAKTAEDYHSVVLTVSPEELDVNAVPEYVNLAEKFFVADEDSGYNAYMKEVDKATRDEDDEEEYKYVGSSSYFEVPTEIYKYIESRYFTESDLTKVIYYKLPETDTFTMLSSTSTVKRFSMTRLGDYEFYVLATDPNNKSLEIDENWKLESNNVGDIEGVYGYYAEEEGVKTLKVPVFGFTLGNRGPQVKAGSSYQDPGYVGTSYTKVGSFTTRGNDLSSKYSLWYNPSTTVGSFSLEEGSGWVEISDKDVFDAEKERLGLEDDDYTALAWSESNLSFTPVKIGSYVVRCVVHDSSAMEAEDSTRIISVTSAMRKLAFNNTHVWFENNWMSVLFLGIAVLSLIGIIVIAFIKPKDEPKA